MTDESDSWRPGLSRAGPSDDPALDVPAPSGLPSGHRFNVTHRVSAAIASPLSVAERRVPRSPRGPAALLWQTSVDWGKVRPDHHLEVP